MNFWRGVLIAWAFSCGLLLIFLFVYYGSMH